MTDNQDLIRLISQQLLSTVNASDQERFINELKMLETEDLLVLANLPEQFTQQWLKTSQCSQFALRQISANPGLLISLAHQTHQQWGRADYQQSLNKVLGSEFDEKCLDQQLRCWRNAMMVRSIWRDLNRLASTLEITAELTLMAECAIETTLRFHYQALAKIKGTPTNAAGEPQTMLVIGMGKLGAYELNLSSDIDLIFAYPEGGETIFIDNGSSRNMASSKKQTKSIVSNQEFFTLLGQKTIKSLDTQTVDGFVYRVDMRLRPYGQSGGLVSNFDSLEVYYLTQGRDWERYAMVKARIVASALPNQEPVKEELMLLLRSFTYRKYVDFTAIEALRDLKRKIRHEIKRQKLHNNIKLGEGGIREVEFIVQALQLIRGGRDTQLQTPSLAECLSELITIEAIPKKEASQLLECYTFLRDTEHAIQAWQDKQTQTLPSDNTAQEALVKAMNFDTWHNFKTQLETTMSFVSQQFTLIIAETHQPQHKLAHEGWKTIWQTADNETRELLLTDSGFDKPVTCAKVLVDIQFAPQAQAADKIGAERLDTFMPLLLEQLNLKNNGSQILLRLQPFVLSIVRRSAYLLLLIENVPALQQLIQLTESSPWIPEQLAAHPSLLDELLNPASLYDTPTKSELELELQEYLLRIPEDDLEQHMESLRYFRRAHALKVAACEVTGKLSLMKVSDYLTELAEVIVQTALHLAWTEMVRKHGIPGGQTENTPNFIIIGYGKLGGIELGHGSDLDLIFIHDANPQAESQAGEGQRSLDNHTFYTRLGQKIIHLLNTNTPSGILYEIDMRLRPSGNSGMLVSTLKAFEKYQKNNAWTWEHQALVRSRVVAGYQPLAAEFDQVRQSVLCTQRDIRTLKQDVIDMRKKMRDNLGSSNKEKQEGQFHLKHDSGGIVDIEFIVQYLVLAYAYQHSQLTQYTDNVRILHDIAHNNILNDIDCNVLVEAYKKLRENIHIRSLQNQSSILDNQDFDKLRKDVETLWLKILAGAS